MRRMLAAWPQRSARSASVSRRSFVASKYARPLVLRRRFFGDIDQGKRRLGGRRSGLQIGSRRQALAHEVELDPVPYPGPCHNRQVAGEWDARGSILPAFAAILTNSLGLSKVSRCRNGA